MLKKILQKQQKFSRKISKEKFFSEITRDRF